MSDRFSMVDNFFTRTREKLYKYDSVRALREHIRPLEHFLFGKREIHFVAEAINRARGQSAPVRVVFDVGAAIGEKTLACLKYFPQAIIHSFEPQSSSRQRLIRCTRRWKERVVIHAYGLYNENATVNFHLYSSADASSILPITEFRRGRVEVGTEPVTVRRLDDCVTELSVAKIDLMKVDVEGAEREVLEGAIRTMPIIDNIFIEISFFSLGRGPLSTNHLEVFRLLHDSGFTLVGQWGDYWFSKDPSVIMMFFGQDGAHFGSPVHFA